MPVVLNASTTTPEDAARIAEAGSLVMAMHNFTPGRRPDWTTPSCWNPLAPYRPPVCVSWRFSLETERSGAPLVRDFPPWSVTGTSFPPPALRTWPCDFTWTVSSWATPASARWSRSGFAAFVTRALSPFPPFWNLNIKICMGARLRPGPTPPPPWSALPNPETYSGTAAGGAGPVSAPGPGRHYHG